MLSNTEIIRKVKGAILPLRCAVEVWDRTSQLELKVLDHKAGIVRIPKITLGNIHDEDELNSALFLVRRQLRKIGYVIN